MAQTRGQPNIDMFRHMVLNSIRGYNLKFKEEYGTQILCADSDKTRVENTFLITSIKENKLD